MSTNGFDKEARQRLIRSILDREDVRGQEELAERLRVLGFPAAQASISRDLREIGAAKIGGVYRVPGAPTNEPSPMDLVGRLILSAAPAGSHLAVVRTSIGGASPVGIAVDRAAWPEVVGTVAGDDTLFVATSGKRATQRLLARLSALIHRENGGRT